jgi:hypothetical protein
MHDEIKNLASLLRIYKILTLIGYLKDAQLSLWRSNLMFASQVVRGKWTQLTYCFEMTHNL